MNADVLALESRGDVVRFRVRVQPRASSNQIAGVQAGALRIRLTAPPVEGAANEALIHFVADRLGVPRRSVSITSGERGRLKTVEIHGVSLDAIRRLASAND